MNRVKKVLLVTGIFFIAIQFIQPAKNINNQVLATDISKTVSIPGNVQAVLKNACYDCHSNNTVYPWYAHIQPVGWLLRSDITEAKSRLNFNEFGNYSVRRQLSKLHAIANVIKDNSMPLPSYKLMNKNARLSAIQKTLLINWALHSQDSLSSK